MFEVANMCGDGGNKTETFTTLKHRHQVQLVAVLQPLVYLFYTFLIPQCSVTCGTGVQRRVVVCDKQQPANERQRRYSNSFPAAQNSRQQRTRQTPCDSSLAPANSKGCHRRCSEDGTGEKNDNHHRLIVVCFDTKPPTLNVAALDWPHYFSISFDHADNQAMVKSRVSDLTCAFTNILGELLCNPADEPASFCVCSLISTA